MTVSPGAGVTLTGLPGCTAGSESAPAGSPSVGAGSGAAPTDEGVIVAAGNALRLGTSRRV